MAKRAPTDIVNLKLRLPEHLRAQLERAARKDDRSLNSEIVARLEESFTRPVLLNDIKSAVRAEATRWTPEQLEGAMQEALRKMEAEGFKIIRTSELPWLVPPARTTKPTKGKP